MNARAADAIAPITVDKISPLLSLGAIGNSADTAQEKHNNQSLQDQFLQKLSTQHNHPLDKTLKTSSVSEFKAAQFMAGQTYSAQVITTLDQQNALVQLNNVMIKMSLPSGIVAGENIALKFMGSEPSPTFLLTQATPTPNIDIARISASAQLIQHYLKPDPKRPVATLIEAHIPITQAPLNNTSKLAHDLQRAISHTGLFYESHLAASIQGKYAMTDIMQEPQNHNAQFAERVVSQQLNLLDQQKLVWHGEIWPQQTIEWEIERRRNTQTPKQPTKNGDTIHSKLSLQLPHLGHVSAELHMQNGKLRIQIQAKDAQTSHTLKNNSHLLAQSLKATGQSLEQLLVTNDVTQP